MLTVSFVLTLLTAGGLDGPCDDLRARREDLITGVVELVDAGPSRMARLDTLRAQVALLGRCRMARTARTALDSLEALILRASRSGAALEPTCGSRPRTIPLRVALRPLALDDGTVMGRLRKIAEALQNGFTVTTMSYPGELTIADSIPRPAIGRNLPDDIGTVDSLLSMIEHLTTLVHLRSVAVEDSTCAVMVGGAEVEWRALMIGLVSTTVRFEIEADRAGRPVDRSRGPSIVVVGLSSGSLQVGGLMPVRTSARGATVYLGAAVNRLEGRTVDRGAVWVGRDVGRWTIVAGVDWQSRVGVQAAFWPRDAGRLSGGLTVSSTGGVGLMVVARPW